MTVIEIIKKYLEDNRYDGLCDPANECGCRLSDLAPCGECIDQCLPGYAWFDSDGGYIGTFEDRQGGSIEP